MLPGGFEDDEPDIVEGQLFRVLSNFDGSVLLELRNGNTARASGPGLADLEPGDVFLLADGRVERLAADSWPAGDRTGTVVWAGSTDIVVKSAGSTYSFRQRADDPFEKGQTVRLGPDGQPVAVIADEPIDDLSLLRDDDFDPESLVVRKEDNTTSVEDFGGNILLVRRALDLATVALSPDDPLRTMGVNPIKGMLFSGPSGTGKTFLARGLAAKLDASFYNVGGPAIVDKFVGQTERRLREIFEHAQDNGPAILFFDEIDSLYTQRGEHNHEATNRLVGQFLSLLDGFWRTTECSLLRRRTFPVHSMTRSCGLDGWGTSSSSPCRLRKTGFRFSRRRVARWFSERGQTCQRWLNSRKAGQRQSSLRSGQRPVSLRLSTIGNPSLGKTFSSALRRLTATARLT